jgi:EAL domain-containing protein (putative c-di-GMP-specific phosphodiesterase class I)
MTTDRIQLADGEILFREGERPGRAFLIESGRIEVSTVQFGVRTVLGELGPGELLGEMAVLDDAPRTATARALSDCLLTPIDRTQFAERLAGADPIVRALLVSQLERYRSTLATLTGDGRTAAPVRGDSPSAVAKIRLESELRGALDRGELDVRLQPIVEIADGSVAGYEALARWTHPERGPISPAEFIRLAEETSLILPVGEHVLARVCDAIAVFLGQRRDPPPFVALNVSARQIGDESWFDRVLDHLHARGLPPACLKLEVTESLVLEQARVGALLDRCHAAGMQVALDDFGTGYSNLAPLITLEFDQIKLDRAFVEGLGQPRGLALAQSILGLARAIGCDVVAEGVENAGQLGLLRDLGCRYAQGWLVGKPARMADLAGR